MKIKIIGLGLYTDNPDLIEVQAVVNGPENFLFFSKALRELKLIEMTIYAGQPPEIELPAERLEYWGEPPK